jgi:2-methylcitrate dehydratase PrpD
VQVSDSIRTFMDRVAVEPDDALLSRFPRQWPSRVEVVTSSGRQERTVTDVPGDPARPFDAAAVEEKFRRIVTPSIGAETAAQTLQHAVGLLNGQTAAARLVRDIEQVSAVRGDKKV